MARRKTEAALQRTEAQASVEKPQATEAPRTGPLVPPSVEGQFFNRELSWIEFNRRVLEEAMDPSQPLLERLKFLSIFSTNLDEFFMIRVSGLMQQVDADIAVLSPDGLSPAKQLRSIADKLRPMVAQHTNCLKEDVLPALAEHGIRLLSYGELSKTERLEFEQYFNNYIFPILTPLGVDPSHPFPYISNLSLNLGMLVMPRDPDSGAEPRFARVKVPPVVPRLLPVNGDGYRFVFLEEIIAANIQALFPQMTVTAIHPFRVTRDADLEIEKDEAGDLLKTVEQQLRRRRFGSAVRLEVDTRMPDDMVRSLTRWLDLDDDDVYAIDGAINVGDLMQIYKLNLPALKDEAFTGAIPAVLRTGESIFDVLRRQDVVLHHPYDAFAPVADFIKAAARDPHVLAIKQTLYRTSGDSPIVQSLIEASEAGKQVAVLVELKARFDEENNITWARKMERAGVHVVYGVVGLKTHCKMALVVRQEGNVLHRYLHLGTGNYNPSTARLYTDLGLLTANPDLGADAAELFNFLTGVSGQISYRKLHIAPVALRDRTIELIRREVDQCKAGREARIVAKVNSLTDARIIRELYDASQAGVDIELIVRGVCCLRPGIPGLSENIRVRSIVGRFLEHSRIFYYFNGGKEDLYLGSADWMNRNLDRRVEIVFPIEDAMAKAQAKDILFLYLRDNLKSRVLHSDGSYTRVEVAEGDTPINAQEVFLRLATNAPAE
jgi:polyphosphate kinase